MPYLCVIDTQRRVIVSILRDRVTFAEATTLQNEMTNHPDFNPEFDRLIDATAVTILDLSMSEAAVIASRRLFTSPSRCAIAATNPAIFGMGRLMQAQHAMAGGQEPICVFYDLASAMQWLGLESLPDSIKPESTKSGESADSENTDEVA